jgi:hypothetical protein
MIIAAMRIDKGLRSEPSLHPDGLGHASGEWMPPIAATVAMSAWPLVKRRLAGA